MLTPARSRLPRPAMHVSADRERSGTKPCGWRPMGLFVGAGQWGLYVGAGLPAIQAPRRVWRCAVMLSPASRLLQRVAANGAFLWELACQRFRHRAGSGVVRGCYRRQAGSYREWRSMGPFCGSWLASDSGTTPCLALCGDAIASKPAPTEGGGQWGLSVGAGLPAIQAPRRVWRCAVMLSPASRLLQRVAANGAFLWELASQRFRHRAVSGVVRGCCRQQAGSYRGGGQWGLSVGAG